MDEGSPQVVELLQILNTDPELAGDFPQGFAGFHNMDLPAPETEPWGRLSQGFGGRFPDGQIVLRENEIAAHGVPAFQVADADTVLVGDAAQRISRLDSVGCLGIGPQEPGAVPCSLGRGYGAVAQDRCGWDP